jgi:RNA polymerase sigma-B factor
MRQEDRAARSRQTAGLFRQLTDDTGAEDRREILQRIVLLNAGVAQALARRYHRRGIDNDDLDQTAYLTLVVAARAFDPGRGHDFLSFAVPTIVGGLKQHFRDHGWTIRVPRRVQEVQLLIERQNLPEVDEPRYGAHTVDRLAVTLDVTPPEVEAALRARGCFRPTSLNEIGARDDLLPSGCVVRDEDERLAVESRAELGPLLRRLTPREQMVLWLRFGEDRTQRAIAAEVDLTQAQVSRILTRIVGELRAQLTSVPANALAR